MEAISLVVGVVMSVGFAIMSWFNLQVERKRSISREKQLIAAILSKDVKDYLDAVDDLEKSPKDKLKQTKAEQDLAIEYEKANKVQRGIPVT
jgi:uncharacterized metal-binding protein